MILTHPAHYDVIVTENLFGDILSDEAAAIAGSLGLMASASLGTRTTSKGRFGMYEPVHGSAPSIAGQGVANPLAAVASAAMLLRWSLGEPNAADSIEAAVDAAIEVGPRTADLGGSEGTAAVADFLLDCIGATARVPA
jgi:3-isopropylmalate dehydrogenase